MPPRAIFFLTLSFSEKSLVAARHRHSSRCGGNKKEPSVSNLPLPCVALLANVFCMTPRESHATCVTCAASCPSGPVSVRTGPVWTDNSASACQRGTMRSFLVRKRVCNTIFSLNGARQRVRGWSCITTATVPQETTVGVCVSPLNFQRLFCASHVWYSCTLCDWFQPSFIVLPSSEDCVRH